MTNGSPFTNASPAKMPIVRLCLAVAVIGSNALILSPVLDPVAAALHATPVEIARAISAYGGGAAAAAFLIVPRIQRIGIERSLVTALLLLGFSLTGSALSFGWISLAISQGFAGLCAGVALPATYALATSAPGPAAAQALGRVLTGWSISLVAGVPLSAFLTQWTDWRVPFWLLALLSFGIAASFVPGFSRTRRSMESATATPSIAALLTIKTVPSLLFICLLYMSAFYGTYAFFGDALLHASGASPSAGGLAVLAYGFGFGLAAMADRAMDRMGASRLFPVVLIGLAAIYLALPFAVVSLGAACFLSFAWGFVNHLGLNTIVLLLSRAEAGARAGILGLNSGVTYLGALLGAGGAGVAYQSIGFSTVCLAAAACLVFAAVTALILSRHAKYRSEPVQAS